ncbi:PD-(D/E)XK nuclease family protein [Deferribacter thermophilus]|uniref:PD-(D/E)XK nuclease family protein n=1 Tax=Deferribacter thermophilus TaxID=53573 RepID=UPI003C202141
MSVKIYKIDLGVNFIHYVSSLLDTLKKEYKKIIFISANRRPIRFIEKSIDLNTALSVDFYTIEDFVKNIVISYSDEIPTFHSSLEREIFFLDLLQNYSTLYNKLGGTDVKVFPWAKRLSKLFDEIDKQLLGNKLKDFYYVEALDEAKEILENLKRLYTIYEENYKNYTYNGNTFKRASELTSLEKFREDFKDTLFIFSGMVYLSNSELKMIKNISDFVDTYFLIQTDLQDRESSNLSFDTFKIVDNLISKLNKIGKTDVEEIKDDKNLFETNFSFYQFPDTHSQAASIFEIVKNKYSTFEDKKSPEKLAVILPDARTLFPLLAFFDNKDNYHLNISMGYPFGNTDVGMFLDSLFLVLIDIDRRNTATGKYIVDSKLLLRLLNSSIVNLFNNEIISSANKLREELFEIQSSTYKFEESADFFRQFLKKFLEVKDIDSLKDSFLYLYNKFDKDKLQKEKYKFTTQILQYFYNEIIENLSCLDSNRKIDILFSYHLLKEIINDMIIPFEGHPLEGIQIMGMLEARSLSFENIIIADVNEGVLPSGDKIDPLLPEEIKVELGLTSFKEKEMLMRYNFFRLVYSAKNVHVMYKSGAIGIDKHIRSRFVEQLILLNELKNKERLKIHSHELVLSKFEKIDNKIEKTEEIKEHFKELFEEGHISPSRLNYYMQCPYAYYLKYIKEVKSKIKLDEDFEADKLGTIVHKFFEENFKNYLGEKITKEILENIKKSIHKEIEKLPDYKYDGKNGEIKSFLNKLDDLKINALKIILKYRVDNYLKYITKNQIDFILVALEEELKSDKLKLYGFADRIDETEDGKIRVIDYKTGTGKVMPSKNKVKKLIDNSDDILNVYDDSTLIEVRKSINSVQIPCYILMAKEKFKNEVESEIHHIGASKGNEIIEKMSDENIEYHKELIQYIFNHMINSEYLYALPDKHCEYCDYNHFCKFNT